MVNTLLFIAVSITLLSLLISLVRFVLGPEKVNRIIAFDVMSVSSIALIAFLSALNGRIIYLDIALIYGILGFIGVLIVARYIEKGL
jgi:multicomponent Na+:H+ antiporter subunit F